MCAELEPLKSPLGCLRSPFSQIGCFVQFCGHVRKSTYILATSKPIVTNGASYDLPLQGLSADRCYNAVDCLVAEPCTLEACGMSLLRLVPQVVQRLAESPFADVWSTRGPKATQNCFEYVSGVRAALITPGLYEGTIFPNGVFCAVLRTCAECDLCLGHV